MWLYIHNRRNSRQFKHTFKMSCAQVRERESCVVALSETKTKEEAKELLDLRHRAVHMQWTIYTYYLAYWYCVSELRCMLILVLITKTTWIRCAVL